MATDLEALRAKLSEIKQVPLGEMRARVELLSARADLEDMASALASETDVDAEIAIIAVRATWMVMLNKALSGDDIDADLFKLDVLQHSRFVIEALATGIHDIEDEIVNTALSKVGIVGKSGVKIEPLRQVMQKAASLIPE